jgi:hypothetical protein
MWYIQGWNLWKTADRGARRECSGRSSTRLGGKVGPRRRSRLHPMSARAERTQFESRLRSRLHPMSARAERTQFESRLRSRDSVRDVLPFVESLRPRRVPGSRSQQAPSGSARANPFSIRPMRRTNPFSIRSMRRTNPFFGSSRVLGGRVWEIPGCGRTGSGALREMEFGASEPIFEGCQCAERTHFPTNVRRRSPLFVEFGHERDSVRCHERTQFRRQWSTLMSQDAPM